jgi:hypothetical protein
MADNLGAFEIGFQSWARIVANSVDDEVRLRNFHHAASEAVTYVSRGLEKPDAIDALLDIASNNGLVDQHGIENIEAIIHQAFEGEHEKPESAKVNGEHQERSPQQDARSLPILRPLPIIEAKIPTRPWIIPGVFMHGRVTVLVAPSGAGKSLLSIQIGLTLAAGVPWANWRPRKQCRVLFINAEDDAEEQERRIAAAFHHMPDLPDAGGFSDYFLIADNPDAIVIAKFDNRTKSLIRTPLIEQLVHTVTVNGIDVIVVDPFAETFQGDENSNSELKWAGMYWREIARRTNAAVFLIHHTKKYATGMAGDVDAARGASALIGIARVVSTLFPMTISESEALGVKVEQRGKFLRYDDAKANLNLTSTVAKWFMKETVTLDNAFDGIPGDEVGVLVPWKPKDELEDVTHEKIYEFFRAVDAGTRDADGNPTGELYTFHSRKQSEHEIDRYLGTFACEFFKGPDGPKPLKAMIEIINKWKKNKRLREVTYRSPHNRKERKGVKSELSPTDDATPTDNVIPFPEREISSMSDPDDDAPDAS